MDHGTAGIQSGQATDRATMPDRHFNAEMSKMLLMIMINTTYMFFCQILYQQKLLKFTFRVILTSIEE